MPGGVFDIIRGASPSSSALIGLRETQRSIAQFGDQAIRVIEKCLYQVGERIIFHAKTTEPSAPVDKGHLRASGFVDLPRRRGSGVELTLGFGGPAGRGNQGETNAQDVGYAEFVHEDFEGHHDGEGEGPKFLETHLYRDTANLDQELADRCRRELGA